MEPIIRTGTVHEQSDRRMMIICATGAAPLAAIIVGLIYSIA
jgi:hypothetical protein